MILWVVNGRAETLSPATDHEVIEATERPGSSIDNVLDGAVEGLRKVKGLIEDALGHLCAVLTNLIEGYSKSP